MEVRNVLFSPLPQAIRRSLHLYPPL